MNLSERQIEKLEAESSAEQQIEKLEAESSAPSTVVGATMLAFLLAMHSLPLEAGIQEEIFVDSRKVVKIQDASSSSSEPVTRLYGSDTITNFDPEIDLYLSIAKKGTAKYSNTLRALAE